MSTHTEDWASIAEQASVEMDPEKLATLVEQLCMALDHRSDHRKEASVPSGSVSHKDGPINGLRH